MEINELNLPANRRRLVFLLFGFDCSLRPMCVERVASYAACLWDNLLSFGHLLPRTIYAPNLNCIASLVSATKMGPKIYFKSGS